MIIRSEPFSFVWIVMAGAMALVAAGLLTGVVRWHANRRQWFDMPNARSSHTIPTPRGGGVGFVVPFLLAIAILGIAGVMPHAHVAAMLPAGALVAVLGYIDDRHSVPALWRFLGHGFAAAWVLIWLTPLPPLPVLGIPLNLGGFGPVLYWLVIVWMVNLYNFMDGIDGLAAVQAVSVAIGGALAARMAGVDQGWIALSLVVFASCVGGFLAWNFPPARIFMGDAGSGFLGFAVALFGLWSAHEQAVLAWSWLILTGLFMVDATATLFRRLLKGERVYEAHRNHAYQYAARRFGSHRSVTLACLSINTFWLTPLACVVAAGWVDGFIASVVAYIPLVALVFHFKAGDRAGQEQ